MQTRQVRADVGAVAQVLLLGACAPQINVMVRPQSAVQALGEAVLAGLVADGLAPAPGRT